MKPTDPRSAQGPAPAHHYTPEELHNVDVAHEHSDINVRAIIASAVALAVVGIVVHVLMYGVFVVFDNQAKENDPQISPLAAPAVQMPPNTIETPTFGNAPQPQLLTNEYAVLARQRQAEAQRLNNYGWVDEAAGTARIPIAEAKKLIAERGLPARAGTAADPGKGTNRPARGEASSGRIVDGPPRGAGLPEVAAPAAPAGGAPSHKGGH